MSKFFFFVLFVICGIAAFSFYFVSQKKVAKVLGEQVSFTIPKEKITKTTLKNGMTVLVMQDESVPKVLLQIAYNVGSSVETSGERGLAHLIEHMIFKGTDKLAEGDLDAIARKYGASMNAFTINDATSYYFEVDSNNWKPFIPILADCMENARFDKEHLAPEIKAVIAELKMYRDSDSRVLWDEVTKMAFPPNHPYHYPLIGFKEDLLNLSSEGLRSFYKKYYHPKRAALFVIGNINPEELVKQAEEHFGKISSEGEDGTGAFPHLSKELITRNSVVYRDIERPKVAFFWRIPGVRNKEDLSAESLEFILGGGEGSRLYKRLVEQDKIANSVSVGAEELMEAGVFLIMVSPRDGKIEECKKVITEELNGLLTNGVTKEELFKMMNGRKHAMFKTLESYASFAFEWIYTYFATGDELNVFKKINQLNDVTSESLQKFAKRYLDPFVMNEVRLLPVPKDKVHVLVEAQAYEDELDKQILSKQVRTTPHEGAKFVKTLAEPANLEFSFPKPTKEFSLRNGIKVILHDNTRWPMFQFNLQFRDASFFADAKEGILVDFLMDMLLEGSRDYTKHDHVKFFEERAVDYNFSSSGASLSILNKGYREVLERLVYILKRPTFPQEALDKLKAIAIDRITAIKKHQPSIAIRALKNLIYPNHPYNWTFDDALELIKSIKVSDLVDAHKKYIVSGKVIISIAGNFNADEMQKTVMEEFATFPVGKYEKREISQEKKVFTPKNVDHYMVRDQVVFLLGQPSEVDIYHTDLVPLKLLNISTFASIGSRIYQLREETGLFYAAKGAFASEATTEKGYDYLYSILSLENIDKSEKLMRGVIDKVGSKGITQEELDVAKKIYMKSLIDASDKNSAVAANLGRLEIFGLGFDYYDKALERVQKMTLAEINEIAKKYFVADKMHRIRVGRVGKA